MSKGHCGKITRQDYSKGKGKNPCDKIVSVNDPYEIYMNFNTGFEWRVLKKHQTPSREAENATKPIDYSRWSVAVQSPFNYGYWIYGDVFSHDITTQGERVK